MQIKFSIDVPIIIELLFIFFNFFNFDQYK